jgi:WhiB family transcriptional regulator, redox-sensing transcriptional regulator
VKHNPQLDNLRPVLEEWEWQDLGACKDTDPELFFLDHNVRSVNKKKKEQAAIKVCKTCPVVQACLAHSLAVPEFYGVWGGVTADQRMSMLRKQGFKGTR